MFDSEIDSSTAETSSRSVTATLLTARWRSSAACAATSPNAIAVTTSSAAASRRRPGVVAMWRPIATRRRATVRAAVPALPIATSLQLVTGRHRTVHTDALMDP